MNKSDLKQQVRKNLGTDGVINISTMNLIVDEVFNIMIEALANGEDVTISNFGTLSTTTVKEHIGRDPQDKTGFIKIPERTRVSFKTGRELKRRVNKED